MPRLLALDTSTERLVVALHGPHGVTGSDDEGGAKASTRIVPAALRLLADAGLSMRDLDAVAFGRGPGAFTGLRTACAVAQGLAFGAAVPVLPLDSLLLVAEDAREQVSAPGAFDLWVAMDARMDEVYAAAYRWDGGWQTTHAPALYTLEALNAHWSERAPVCIAGSALMAFGTRLHVGAAHTISTPHDRVGALARLAHAAWHDGATVDPALALPLYLRDKVALTTQERAVRAARAA